MNYNEKLNFFDLRPDEDKIRRQRQQNFNKLTILVGSETELEHLPKHIKSQIEKSPAVELVVTGVGKINATIAAMNCFYNHKDIYHHIICNIGTAESFIYPKGTLGIITKTAERDVDPVHLIPYDDRIFEQVDMDGYTNQFLHLPYDSNILYGGTCWTGDNTHAHTEQSEVMKGEFIDMEGAAIVKTYNSVFKPNFHHDSIVKPIFISSLRFKWDLMLKRQMFVFKWVLDGAGEVCKEEWKDNHSIPSHIWLQIWDILKKNKCVDPEWSFKNTLGDSEDKNGLKMMIFNRFLF